jgi:hypothetical protein
MTNKTRPVVQTVTDGKRNPRTAIRHPRATTGDAALASVITLWSVEWR